VDHHGSRAYHPCKPNLGCYGLSLQVILNLVCPPPTRRMPAVCRWDGCQSRQRGCAGVVAVSPEILRLSILQVNIAKRSGVGAEGGIRISALHAVAGHRFSNQNPRVNSPVVACFRRQLVSELVSSHASCANSVWKLSRCVDTNSGHVRRANRMSVDADFDGRESFVGAAPREQRCSRASTPRPRPMRARCRSRDETRTNR